jgi:hypothetical protein
MYTCNFKVTLQRRRIKRPCDGEQSTEFRPMPLGY